MGHKDMATPTPNPHAVPERKRRLRLLVGVGVALAGIVLTACAFAQSHESAAVPAAAAVAPAKPAPFKFIKGGNISAWNVTDVGKVYADAKRLGLDTLTLSVRMRMSAAAGHDVAIDQASLEFAKKVVAAGAGYNFIVEPYPWIADGNVPETDLNPADKAAWFAAWQKAILELAKEFPNSWGMYVASNIGNLEDQSASWTALIDKLRSAYKGRIIYRTNWWFTASWAPETVAKYRTKLENPLFGKVDVIAIAAYFEVSEAIDPSTSEVKAALRSTTVSNRKQDIFKEVMDLGAKWHKPIFFGELSCPSVDFGAQNPWDPAVSDKQNPNIQKNYLQAYLETFVSDPSKFLGFSLFTIGHPTATTYELAPSAAEYIRAFKP